MTAIANLKTFAAEKDRWIPLVIERLRDQDAEVRRTSLSALAEAGDKAVLPLMPQLLKDESDDVRQEAVSALRILGGPENADLPAESSEIEEDREIKLSMLKTAVELGSVKALVKLGRIVQEESVFADDAFDALKGHLDASFGKKDTKKLIEWISKHEAELRWNPLTKTFTVSSGSWRAKAHF